MKRVLSRLLPALAILLFAGAASAQTFQNFQVQANVAKKCRVTIAAATLIMTASYDPFAVGDQAQDFTNQFTVNCTKTTTFDLRFNKASGTMAGVTAGNTDTLAYNLFQLGTTTAVPVGAAAASYSGPVTGAAGMATDYQFGLTVSLTAGQDPQPDTYRDTVQATVNF